MRLVATPLAGAYVVELDLLGDERGWFARTYDAALFAEHGLERVGVQANTLVQRARATRCAGCTTRPQPHGEAKLVRCVRGAIWDVGVDLRPDSRHVPAAGTRVELSADNRRGFYLPAGLAHGFQTLTDDCEVQLPHGRTSTCPRPRAACAGTTRRSRSTWPEPPAASARCPTRTAPIRTSRRDAACSSPARAASSAATRSALLPRAASRSTPSRAARRAPAPDGVRWHAADLLDAGARRASWPTARRRTCCTSPGTPSPGRSGRRARTPPGWRRRVGLLDAFAAAGGRRAVLAGTCAEYDWGAAPAARRGRAARARDALRRLQGRHAAGRGGARGAGRAVAGVGRASSSSTGRARTPAPARRRRRARARRRRARADERRHAACATSCTSTTSRARSRRSVDSDVDGAVNVASGGG